MDAGGRQVQWPQSSAAPGQCVKRRHSPTAISEAHGHMHSRHFLAAFLKLVSMSPHTLSCTQGMHLDHLALVAKRAGIPELCTEK